MTTQKSKECYSRTKARRMVKELYPDLPQYKLVHHIDLNPFHNEMHNFAIMSNSDHMKLHWALNPKRGNTKPLLKDLSDLESWLIFYNNNYAI